MITCRDVTLMYRQRFVPAYVCYHRKPGLSIRTASAGRVVSRLEGKSDVRERTREPGQRTLYEIVCRSNRLHLTRHVHGRHGISERKQY